MKLMGRKGTLNQEESSVMAAGREVKDPTWVRKLKFGGAVPLLNLDDCPNGWASPPGNNFHVRGPNYLHSKLKIPGGEWLLKPLGFDWIKSLTKIYNILKHPNGRVRAALKDACTGGQKGLPMVWAFNLQVPSKDNHSLISYFVSYDPVQEGSLVDRFLKGNNSFRKSRLKLIANVVKGPWIVKTAVGEQAVCILGKAVTCRYFQGDNYIEVDVDIGASMMANAIVHLAFGYVTTLTVDLAFLIEGQAEDELPERILGAIRFSNLDPASAACIEHPLVEEDGILENGDASRPSYGWRSFSTAPLVGYQNAVVEDDDGAGEQELNGSL